MTEETEQSTALTGSKVSASGLHIFVDQLGIHNVLTLTAQIRRSASPLTYKPNQILLMQKCCGAGRPLTVQLGVLLHMQR